MAGDATFPAAGAGPALESFGRDYAAELAETIRTRLVQTSVVQRTLGLRIGLSAIAAAARAPRPGPLHVIEVGASRRYPDRGRGGRPPALDRDRG